MDQNKEDILATEAGITPTEAPVHSQNEAISTETAAPTSTPEQAQAPNFYGQTPPFINQPPRAPQPPQQQYVPNQQHPNNVTWQNGVPPMPPMPADQPLSTGKGFSIASLVLGILCVIMAGTAFSLITSVLAIVFGVIGRKKSKAALGKPNGLATAGFVLGIIGISITLLSYACTCTCDTFFGFDDYGDYDI